MYRSVLAMLDMSKAFDHVWRDRFLLQMIKICALRQFVRWLRTFLLIVPSERKLTGFPADQFDSMMVRLAVGASIPDRCQLSDPNNSSPDLIDETDRTLSADSNHPECEVS